ncbi:WD40-repeat-containing domain protein [Entophlyctis helioformis]|nr:WD40-repeat-containing domain protein [Entophlyctis helioformis]
MISSLAWVRKGAAQELPERVRLTEEEFERISSQMGVQLQLAKESLADAQAAAGAAGAADDAMAEAKPTAGSGDDGDNNQDEDEGEDIAPKMGKDKDDLSIYNLDGYDDENNADDDGLETEGHVSLFSNIRGLAYHNSNKEDPYVQLDDEEDEKEELDEMRINPSDNLILASKTEDDISHLEVYVYEEEEDNLYVHHDILLPSFPLCVEWLDFPVGRKAGKSETGNFVAVGTFEPQVEIWDLDTVDSMFPECILGALPDAKTAASEPEADLPQGGKKGKKKKKKNGAAAAASLSSSAASLLASRRPNPERHVDAVMAIAWNKVQRNLVATGSADTTVKLWDLNRPATAIANYTHHTNKVQAVAWNRAEPAVLLTGGYDRRACAFDSRAPGSISAWTLTADVECIKWDPIHSERFLVSTEDGIVKAFDVRKGAAKDTLFTLHAHDAAVSALDISSHIDGCIITGSGDKMVKIWSITDNKPSCIVSRDVGWQGLCCAFSPDSPYVVSIAGSKGNVVMWNLEENAGMRRAFPGGPQSQTQAGQPGEEKRVRRELTVLEPDNEPEEEDEDDEMDADAMAMLPWTRMPGRRPTRHPFILQAHGLAHDCSIQNEHAMSPQRPWPETILCL